MSRWFKQCEMREDFYLACDFWSMFVMEMLRLNIEISAKGICNQTRNRFDLILSKILIKNYFRRHYTDR